MPSKSLEETVHDNAVKKLYFRLQEKGRYFTVGLEVPFFKKGLIDKKGQADILTIDTTANRITYWEVKMGQTRKSLKKAKRQAQTFYAHMRTHPLYNSYEHEFVYYNPVRKQIKRL